jgi:hypothetical protein
MNVDPIPYLYGKIILNFMAYVANESIFFGETFEPNYKYEGILVDLSRAWRMGTNYLPSNADNQHVLEAINILAQSGCFRVVIEPAAGDKIIFRARKLIKVYKIERRKNRVLEFSSLKAQKMIYDSLKNIYDHHSENFNFTGDPGANNISLAFQGNLGGKARGVKYNYKASGPDNSGVVENRKFGVKAYTFGLIGALIFVWQAFVTGAIQAVANIFVNIFAGSQ